jgi:hypothetical protein
MLQGQMHVRVAREAADPLTVTALAIGGEQEGNGVILISCDLAMISPELQASVREKVTALLPEVEADAIIMNATHTHDAPVITDGFYPHPGGDVMTAAEGLEHVAACAAEAALEAWARRVPGTVERAFGHAVVGHNRRVVYADGHAEMYGATTRPDFRHIEGYEDHSVDMLFFRDAAGHLSGMAIVIPCPSQVEESLTTFSADFWHDIRVELRRRFGDGLPVLALCGAAGDQSPHFLLYGRQEEEMRRRGGVSERQEIALRVGDAVERALRCGGPEDSDQTVCHRCQRITCSPRRITQAERDWAETARSEALARGDDPGLWWPLMLGDILERFDRGQPMPAYEAELHALRIGEAVIVTNPFELYLDYALEIKARSLATQTLTVQLAAGTGLYLPTERAVQGGHYGAHPAVAPVGPEGGRELVEASLLLIRDIFTTHADNPQDLNR